MIDYKYFDLFSKNSIDKQLTITTDDGLVTITNVELNQENFELTESICSESELKFGCCEASSVKFRISDIRNALKDKWLTIKDVLDGNSDASFQLGRYKVFSDKPTADKRYRDIVAYDAMYDIVNSDVASWYNEILPSEDSTVTMKEFRTSFISYFGLEQEDVELINDSMTVEKTIVPLHISGKDVLSAICELNGCFGHIGRDGKFKYVLLPKDQGIIDFHNGNYISCDYEDYITSNITKLQIRQTTGDIGITVGIEGNVYVIEDNFLMYGKATEDIEKIATNLLSVIEGICYRPFSADVKGNPCVEVGDRIKISTKYCDIESYILKRTLSGIQALRDTYEADGVEYYTEKLNSIQNVILKIKETVDGIQWSIEEADIRYVKTEELDAVSADISKAVIDTIDGRYASIEYIQTNYASMLEFDALKGKVDDLQTDMLTAESALIKNLQSMVTKTDTLIFGAAGGTSIQTEFSNSVIAMLGEAQIKSAMIESVSASKVTAGTIYTDDVTIQSKDGKTRIMDNTMQISDGTRVRVQIGKDASNDYSINVWDASGNIMFSEGGITDSAIKEAIIRNDMVSENANINAAKLDIDSLFEEINGSSKTIKSTKVYFDSEKQTLDAAFKSMTTTVSGLQSTQSSQGTQITAIQGQITSKVWQSDIDTAVNGVEGDISTLSTKYTTLNQTVNGLSSTVGSHTTQINSLDTRVDSAESNITQHANLISLRVEKSGVISAINQSAENIKISAAKIELEGAVTFSSFDSATQELINDTTYTVTGTMTGITGTATVEIYKNGVLCTESLYLSLTYLDGSGGTTWKSSSNGGTVSTGKKTWSYTSVRAYRIEVYTSSAKTKFLCGCILSYGATGATGAAGSDGENGLGVSSIVEQYYLSSSSTSQSGGSWSATCPAWKSGYYIWTRSYITWSDGTTTTTTPALANAINSANTNANTAVSTANTANDTASDALTAANTASSNASSALSTANTASTNATSALNRATYHYGTCSTAAGTAAKAVTLSGFALYTGAMVSVYFSNANTASSPTLNVNGTGAKSIRVNNAAITSKYYWRAKDTVTFIYNGTYWVMADTSANSLLASWCSDNDKTLIDGGKIYASEAFLENIFSKNITATGTITGAQLIGAHISADSFQFVDDSNNLLREVQFLHEDIQLSITDNNYATPATYTAIIELMAAGGLVISGRGMTFYDWDTMSFNGNANFSDTIIANKVTTYAGADLDELNSKLAGKANININNNISNSYNGDISVQWSNSGTIQFVYSGIVVGEIKGFSVIS